MPKSYLSRRYKRKLSPYLKTLSDAERDVYFSETESAVSELVSRLGKDPKEVRWIILSIGRYLYGNTGKDFYLDYQKIPLSSDITLWVLQPPAGGCIHLFETPAGKVLVDCGYGMNYADWCTALADLGLGSFADVKHLLCTHGDADHMGMAGLLPAPAYMHPTTRALLESGSRGFSAVNEYQNLNRTYTKTINTISGFVMPKEYIPADTVPKRKRGAFSVIDEISFGGLTFEVWESRGGHLAGQLFYYEPRFGLLFTSDAILNFASISMSRRVYGSIPDYLITSANINSALASEERAELFAAAKALDAELKAEGKRLRLCCGHGAASVFDDAGNLAVFDSVYHYARRNAVSAAVIRNLTKISWMIEKKLC